MGAKHIAFAFLVSSYTVTSAHAALQLVDDRGRGVEGKVEVCFQVATRNACSSVRGDGPIEVPPDFVSVRAEGPGHGPVSMARQRLKQAPNGDLLLALPRKARLQIVAGAEERLALSLFPHAKRSGRAEGLIPPLTRAGRRPAPFLPLSCRP